MTIDTEFKGVKIFDYKAGHEIDKVPLEKYLQTIDKIPIKKFPTKRGRNKIRLLHYSHGKLFIGDIGTKQTECCVYVLTVQIKNTKYHVLQINLLNFGRTLPFENMHGIQTDDFGNVIINDAYGANVYNKDLEFVGTVDMFEDHLRIAFEKEQKCFYALNVPCQIMTKIVLIFCQYDKVPSKITLSTQIGKSSCTMKDPDTNTETAFDETMGRQFRAENKESKVGFEIDVWSNDHFPHIVSASDKTSAQTHKKSKTNKNQFEIGVWSNENQFEIGVWSNAPPPPIVNATDKTSISKYDSKFPKLKSIDDCSNQTISPDTASTVLNNESNQVV